MPDFRWRRYKSVAKRMVISKLSVQADRLSLSSKAQRKQYDTIPQY